MLNPLCCQNSFKIFDYIDFRDADEVQVKKMDTLCRTLDFKLLLKKMASGIDGLYQSLKQSQIKM